MQANRDLGVDSLGHLDRDEDRALVLPGTTDRGLLRRVTILLGVSWGYHKPPPSHTPRPTYPLTRRFAAALSGFALLATGMTPALSLAGTYDATADMNSMYSTTQYSGAQAWWTSRSSTPV
jgi:hypothetical protein